MIVYARTCSSELCASPRQYQSRKDGEHDAHGEVASAGPYMYSDWMYFTRASWIILKVSGSRESNLSIVKKFNKQPRADNPTNLLSRKSSRTLNAKNLTCGGYFRSPPSVPCSTKRARAHRQVIWAFCWIEEMYSRAWACKGAWEGSDAIRMAWVI